MTQNHIILIFFIELLVFYFIVYTLIKADKLVKNKINIIQEYSSIIPEIIILLRAQLEKFNLEFDKKFKNCPLNPKELGILTGIIFTDIVKLKFSPFPKKKLFIIIGIAFRLWKYKDKIIATIINKRLNSF